jgi:hypothetical protein
MTGSPLEFPDFRPRAPWWGPDLQTLRNFFSARTGGRPKLGGDRLHLEMRDGSGDRLAALLTPAKGDKPLVVLIHGLTGCETSMNMVRAAIYHRGLGYPVLRLNLRGAGPSRATCKGDYHAGCSRDLADALSSVIETAPELTRNGLYLSAVSLGANVMIKFLAEYGADFPVRAAASVSAPIDLAASARSVMRRRNALYHRWLLGRMKFDCGGSDLTPEQRALLERARTVYEFDDRFLAPRYGFEGADHYYEESKAARFLGAVPTPTLVIHARNDPWIPAAPYLANDWSRNGKLTPLLPRAGGHVGFHDPGHEASWHDRCSAEFFAAH